MQAKIQIFASTCCVCAGKDGKGDVLYKEYCSSLPSAYHKCATWLATEGYVPLGEDGAFCPNVWDAVYWEK